MATDVLAVVQTIFGTEGLVVLQNGIARCVANDFALFILRVVTGGYLMKYGLPKLRDVDGSFAKGKRSWKRLRYSWRLMAQARFLPTLPFAYMRSMARGCDISPLP